MRRLAVLTQALAVVADHGDDRARSGAEARAGEQRSPRAASAAAISPSVRIVRGSGRRRAPAEDRDRAVRRDAPRGRAGDPHGPAPSSQVERARDGRGGRPLPPCNGPSGSLLPRRRSGRNRGRDRRRCRAPKPRRRPRWRSRPPQAFGEGRPPARSRCSPFQRTPVRVGRSPVSREACAGRVIGATAKARSKTTPRRASSSRFGVVPAWLP